jgi:FkbM family methyltransferase
MDLRDSRETDGTFPADVRFEFAGRTFVFDDANGSDLVAKQMQAGSYEIPLPILLMAAVTRTKGLFLDIGANNGLYSILAAKARPDAKVIAFEPYQGVRDVLISNLKLNEVKDRVEVCNVALSDKTGLATLHIPDGSHGLLETSASLEADFKPFSQTASVPTIRLDELDLGDKVSVIKIDVEGHEAAVLRGAAACLEQHRPIVFAEMLLGAQLQFPSITERLSRLDYLFFRLRPDCAIHTKVIKFDTLAWNYAFVPPSAIQIFLNCCSTHSIEVLTSF